MKKPTVESIQERVADFEEHWNPLHTAQKEWQQYYNLEYKVKLPKDLGAEQYTPRTAYDWVKVGVNNYMLDNPMVEVAPRDDKDTAEQDSIAMETFGNSLWQRNAVKVRDNATIQLVAGQFVYKIGVNEAFLGNDWEDLAGDERKALQDLALTEYPIRIETPHPVNVFPSPDFATDYVPSECAEKYEMTVAAAKGLCERNGWSTSWAKDKNPKDKVEYVSWYSAEWRCVIVDGHPVLKGKVAPNILGFVPYVIGGAGMGVIAYDGNVKDYYKGIVAPNKGMIDVVTQTLSQLVQSNAHFAYPKVILELEDMTSAEQVKKEIGEEFDLSPSSVTILPPGTTAKYLESQGSAQAQMVQQLAMLLGIASPPTGMAGGQMTGVYSGSYANTRIAYEKTWYKDPFKIHEDVLAVATGRVYQIIKNVIRHPISMLPASVAKGEPAKLTHIGPGNIPNFACKVRLLADSPEAADIKKHLGIMTFQAGLMDAEGVLVQYYDMSRKEAENTVDKCIEDKAVHNNPAVLEAIAIKSLEETGQDDIAAYIKNMGYQMQRGGARPHPGAQSEPASKVAPAQTRPSGMEAGENPTQIQAMQ